MKNFSSKKALFLSVISMVICVSMLIGSTFAWFTDSATANVNTIQAGNLDVELVGKDGKTLTEALKWVKSAEAPEGEKVLWEPGCKYNLEPFAIKNSGFIPPIMMLLFPILKLAKPGKKPFKPPLKKLKNWLVALLCR